MNKGLIASLSFLAGGAVGYFIAKRSLNEACEQMIQDEVRNVKEAFRKSLNNEQAQRFDKAMNSKGKSDDNSIETEKERYKEAIRQSYRPESKTEQQLHDMAEKLRPRVIKPDEYGEKDNYEQVTFLLLADGTIVNDEEKALTNVEVEQSIGSECLNHFGEYEEDSVFVRNDALKTDYEVLKDLRTYKDILRKKPYLADD